MLAPTKSLYDYDNYDDDCEDDDEDDEDANACTNQDNDGYRLNLDASNSKLSSPQQSHQDVFDTDLPVRFAVRGEPELIVQLFNRPNTKKNVFLYKNTHADL